MNTSAIISSHAIRQINRRLVGQLWGFPFLLCLLLISARADILQDFAITNGSVIFDVASTTTSFSASNLTLNVATRYAPYRLQCAGGSEAGSRPFVTGLGYELARGNVRYRGQISSVSMIESYVFTGLLTIPATNALQVTALGYFTFTGRFRFDDFSNPANFQQVTANLSGAGIVSVPLRQAEPGVFFPDGPQRYDFLPVYDSDGDGVFDDQDQCPDTPPGAVVDSQGCSLDQLVPCAGSLPGEAWKNHGQYVSAMEKATTDFYNQGLINMRQKEEIISAAARSGCGKISSPRF
jgi:hypothetical protein